MWSLVGGEVVSCPEEESVGFRFVEDHEMLYFSKCKYSGAAKDFTKISTSFLYGEFVLK